MFSPPLKFDKVPKTDGVTMKPFDQSRLFINGVHPDDVDQGLLGDCFFLSSIASIAQQNGKFIQKMVSAEPDGTFRIQLYKRRFLGPPVPKTIIVDNLFPVKDDKPVFAGLGDSEKTAEGVFFEIWPMVLEKGYAQLMGSYNAIIGGWPHDAMTSLTGKASRQLNPATTTVEQLADLFESKHAIAIYTRSDFRFNLGGRVIDLPDRTGHSRFKKHGGDLSAGHAYFISGVSRADNLIKIRNPWGWEHGEIELTQAEMRTTMRGISVNRIE